MPSPFPGMDPYLEGYLWPDLHHSLATQIARQLAPRLRPRYVARLKIREICDRPSKEEIQIMYPALETTSRQHHLPLTVPLIEMRVVNVEIRDVAKNELVTTIEIISPANKHEPGWSQHHDKFIALHKAGVHVLEIDLLRRGKRTVSISPTYDAAYLIALTRASGDASNVWPIRLREKLPVVPVPLRKPDPDVPLDLNEALAVVYDEAGYDLSIDYRQAPPPPALSSADVEWLQSLKLYE